MRWRLVERIDELVPGERVRGTALFPGELELFGDHFPRFPVVPGVILLEAMAQLAGKGIGYSIRLKRGDWPFPILSMMQAVKFRRFVKPDERVVLEADLVDLREDSAQVKVRTRGADGKIVAQAEQVFVYNAVPLPNDEDRTFLETTERGELQRLWAGMPADSWARP